jgi:hypothetical protein
LLGIRCDKEENLPVKAQTVGFLEDMQDTSKLESNETMMKAFASILRERV